ncbi:hypothetical protein GOP47_0027129 [Adiantum capillus-veneris]|nr:hypothetical protein GOP47_0027129 [Adiantum capillus-veneris]
MPLFLHLTAACNVDEHSKHPNSAGTQGDLVEYTSSNDLEATGEPSNAAALHKAEEGSALVKTGAEMRKWFAAIDWRSLIHSFKAGLALGLVSCGVLLQPVYERLGKNVLWALLTVVVVFECTVGATFSKGLNRGLGTFLAASVGLLFDHIANNSGPHLEPYIVGGSIFVVGMATTYARFFPTIKAKYDYGMVMFLLTFCLVVVSGYRGTDNLDLALDRMLTVFLGCLVCVVVSVFICPVWAGDDLHNLIVNNLDDLAEAIEGCTKAYFLCKEKEAPMRTPSKIFKGEPFSDPIYKGYRAVLLSKQTEEGLANQARWEPWHGRFGCMYPWQQCIQVGAILRHCAYSVCALHGCVLSEIQAPEPLRQVFSQPCMQISLEVVRVLRDLAMGLRECRKTRRSKQSMLRALHMAVLHLQASMESYNHQVAQTYNTPSSAVENHRDSEVEVPNSPPSTSGENEEDSSEVINGNATDSSVQQQQQPHQFKRLFSATLLQPPYCLPDLHYNRATSVSVIGDDERLQRCREFTECLSVTTVSTLLIEIVSRLEPLLRAVEELEEQALFKDPDAPKPSWARRPNLKRYKTEKLLVQHATAQIHPL